MSGIIYISTCMENGKQYVGRTIKDLWTRKHLHEKKAKYGSKFHFHNALRKYGASACRSITSKFLKVRR